MHQAARHDHVAQQFQHTPAIVSEQLSCHIYSKKKDTLRVVQLRKKKTLNSNSQSAETVQIVALLNMCRGSSVKLCTKRHTFKILEKDSCSDEDHMHTLCIHALLESLRHSLLNDEHGRVHYTISRAH